MYQLCFLSDALAAQGAVQCGECARILRPVRTTQAHSEKLVTADKNIATFSASKQDSQPYMFLTWKSQLRLWNECIYLNSIEQKLISYGNSLERVSETFRKLLVYIYHMSDIS